MARKEKRIFEIQKKIDTWVNSKEAKECLYTKYLVYAPNLLDLLVKLSFDNSLNSQDVSHINSAIKYFDSAFDLFPEEFLGIPGYLDDIFVSAYVISNISNEINNPIIKKHWTGDFDIFELAQLIIEDAEEMLGKNIYSKLKNNFSR